ncbi:MAG TPA: TetR/AcrR family transcriptional regulator [Acidisarcina sp.]|nr:TetR/AcrR family transcriptional regulator [Acidisarcina sp.]
MGRRERRAAETRLRLFRSALQLIAERGLSHVTVEDITKAADVGKGTFFNYFPTKDHVLGVMAEIQLGKVHEALDQATSGKRTIQYVLRHLMARIGEEPGRSPDLARAFISSFAASAVVREQIDRNMLDGRGMVAKIIEIGQQRGEIDSRLKKEKLAWLLQQTFFGTLLVWSLHGEPPLQDLVHENFKYFWRAIAAPRRR